MNENKNNIEIMKYIATMYKDVKKQMKEGNRPIQKNYTIDPGVEFVHYIDSLLEMMPSDYQKIIQKDFLEERTKKWWQEYYKKSTYYRRKSEAIQAFVDCVTK